MYRCSALEQLLRKYEDAQTKEDLYVKSTLQYIQSQLTVCNEEQRYYADMVTRNFCHIIDMMEKQQGEKRAECNGQWFAAGRRTQYQCSQDLVSAFYDFYREGDQVQYQDIGEALEKGRKDLVNSTMKDYVARIYTFAGKRYLGQMFSLEELGNRDPVLFVYDNIERILATFRTRDAEGQIVKQRVNIRSALRKLNEFKQQTEQ